MAWAIEFAPHASRELDKLDPQIARRIVRFLNDRLARLEDPRSIGEALTGPELGRFWKYRVGDYRIVAAIEDQVLRVVIVRVAHRRESYR